MRKRNDPIIVVAAFCVLATGQVTLAQPEGILGYDAVEIIPLPDDDYVNPSGLSDEGWVALESVRRHANVHPGVWINGVIHPLPGPEGYERPRVRGIAPTRGTILGSAYSHPHYISFVWCTERNIITVLDGLGTDSSSANAVNDRGVVAGTCVGDAVLWRRSVVPEKLGTAPYTGASAINQFNEVAGSCDSQAAMWDADGNMTIIPLEGERTSRTDDINDLGQVVGAWPYGFLYDHGTVTKLPDTAVPDGIVHAYAINNLGQIVGRSSNESNYVDATLWWGDGGQQVVSLAKVTVRGLAAGQRPYDGQDINNAGQIIVGTNDDFDNEMSYLFTPYNFSLSDPVPGRAGRVNMFQATGLQPGQRVRLAAGFGPGAQALPESECLGGMLLIQDLRCVFPPATADNSGTATFVIYVPHSLQGQALRMQAFDRNNCTISHSVDWTWE